ncbi:MAG: UDP-N-acetylglucosamine pyrophosphorylase [Deltaproteobacteria bacterium]|nr:UDP-N-acetylglucosamine pyrophosphorylase [Deltaproteobacteria bacterium]MBN2846455.1 UDP-N-acetylglucosamine pyrophosphorylase [Deltaproteobacteria bacterium]
MGDEKRLSDTVIRLMERGVSIPNPSSVEIGDDVEIERISKGGIVLYSGTKIYGSSTLIGSGTKLGYEAPVTLSDCQIGPGVELKGGFFKKSVFLEKANMASGAQVREGCILEEEANGSHTVGIKQTILFPFVTLGSLINFCDCFMAGGTSRKNHSEVGSSYIHFNYTPNQDKATASLIGDVPRGVMLDQPPIFLGGQGGLVGPARIGYGTVIAAGSVYRGDCPEGGKLLSEANTTGEKDFYPGFYGDIQRRVTNNIFYLANLLALREWYLHVRKPFFEVQEFGAELYEGMREKLDMAIEERLKRFAALSEKMEQSMSIAGRVFDGKGVKELIGMKREFSNNWSRIEECFARKYEEKTALDERNAFLEIVVDSVEKGESGYLATIQSLSADEKRKGTIWLQSIVDHIAGRVFDLIPSYRK